MVYLSAAAPVFEDIDLEDILMKSRANNTKSSITGLLLFHEGNFIQVIEGEQSTLHSLYNKISRDNRHRLLIKMIDEPTDKRSFPDWSMGYKAVSTDEIQKLTGFNSLIKKDFLDAYQHSENGQKKIITLLRSFVNVNMS
jgi:hypothetical protein